MLGYGRVHGAAIPQIVSPRFYLRCKQSLARSVEAITVPKKRVGEEHAVAPFVCSGVVNVPGSEIESVVGRIQQGSASTRVTYLVTARVGGAGVDFHLDTIDGGLIIPGDGKINLLVEIALLVEGKNPAMNAPGTVVPGVGHRSIDYR